MNPLIRKLRTYIDLPQADRKVLEDLSRKPEPIPAHTDLIREGAVPDNVYLIPHRLGLPLQGAAGWGAADHGLLHPW